jgi:beta-lactamase regulating signal transducer with metallopeptidase domain
MSFEISLIVKPVLVLTFVSVLSLLLRRASASVLHGIWALGLFGVLALPVVAVLLPTVDLPVLPARDTAPVVLREEPVAAAAAVSDTDYEVSPAAPAPETAAPVERTWRYWLGLTWGLGSCAVFMGWILALWELRRWKRSSSPVESADWLNLLAELRQDLSVYSAVRLWISDQSVPPMTWGIFRPVIMIPAEAAGWTAERRRVVLAHELGHVKRYDGLGQILCQCACGIYWFNPLVWYAAHRLHVERERACDDIVLRLGARAADYADHLVQIARGLNAGFSWTVVSMAHPSQLKSRVLAILDPQTRRQRLSRWAACGFLSLVVVLTVSAAVIQLTALASMTVPMMTAGLPVSQGPEAPTTRQAVAPEISGTARIEGRVVKEDGDAVAGAAVELRNVLTGTKPVAVVADERGNFAFKDLAPGEYRLAATATGHVRSEYGQERLNGPGLAIGLRSGQEMKNVSLPLVATAAISGQIRGPNGLPAANVQVHALQYGYEDGRRVLKTVRVMKTDDRGNYRLFWLPPGEYRLMAVPLVGDLENTILIVGGDGTTRAFTSVIQPPTAKAITLPDESSNIPVFFPGTVRAEDSSVLALKSGEDRTGVHMSLMRTPAFRVRGTLTNPPPFIEGNAAGPPTIASVRLESLSPSILERRSAPSTIGAVDIRTGVFEIRGVLPGAYNLVATASAGGRNRTPIFARVPVEVVNNDVADLRVTLAPGFDVSAKVAFEGKETQIPDMIRVSFNQNVAQPDPAQPRTYTARNLQPNHYRIRVETFPGLPFNGYLKRVMVGDRDVRDTGLTLQGPLASPIEILISLDGASFVGTVVTGQRQPAANASIVLVPNEPLRDRVELYKNARSGMDGTFRFVGITPGDYRVFAWSDVEDGAWHDPEFMKTYENRGVTVRFAEGTTRNAEVVAIP